MWTRTRPVGDDEEPVLDAAALDDRGARLERHFLEDARHRDKRVARDIAEQRDPLEHRDALDRHELAHAVPTQVPPTRSIVLALLRGNRLEAVTTP